MSVTAKDENYRVFGDIQGIFIQKLSGDFFFQTNYVTSRPPVSLMATVKVQQCSIGVLQVGLHAFIYFH